MGKLKRILLGTRALRQAEWYLSLAENKAASLDQRRDALERAIALRGELQDIARPDNEYIRDRNQALRLLERLRELSPVNHHPIDNYL